jgi:hypothetical protein
MPEIMEMKIRRNNIAKPMGSPAVLDQLATETRVVEPAKLQATMAATVKVLGAAQIEYAARRAAGL